MSRKTTVPVVLRDKGLSLPGSSPRICQNQVAGDALERKGVRRRQRFGGTPGNLDDKRRFIRFYMRPSGPLPAAKTFTTRTFNRWRVEINFVRLFWLVRDDFRPAKTN